MREIGIRRKSTRSERVDCHDPMLDAKMARCFGIAPCSIAFYFTHCASVAWLKKCRSMDDEKSRTRTCSQNLCLYIFRESENKNRREKLGSNNRLIEF